MFFSQCIAAFGLPGVAAQKGAGPSFWRLVKLLPKLRYVYLCVCVCELLYVCWCMCVWCLALSLSGSVCPVVPCSV